jgi:hypothetical protein
MLPEFLLEENAVRGSGEGPVFDTRMFAGHSVILTLGITHAVEQESLELDLLASEDGLEWGSRPILSFTPKFYCGTYQMSLPQGASHFIKPVWRVSRWARGQETPFFRFYLCGEPSRRGAMAGAA